MHHYNVYNESSSIWIFIPYCIYHWTYTTFNIIMYSRVHLLSHSSSLYVYYSIHTLYIDYCTLQHHIIIGYTSAASKHCIFHLIFHTLLVHVTLHTLYITYIHYSYFIMPEKSYIPCMSTFYLGCVWLQPQTSSCSTSNCLPRTVCAKKGPWTKSQTRTVSPYASSKCQGVCW